MDALAVGETVRRMGGGRFRTDDIIDPAVGWEQLIPPGRDVAAGELLGIVHAGASEIAAQAGRDLEEAVIWDSPVDDLVLGEL
jgi:thymidine phosphorylase